MLIRIPKRWEIPEREATPENVYWNRREILKAAGIAAAAPLAALGAAPFPAQRNPDFRLDREITPEAAATGYNNYYEFDPQSKENVRNRVGRFKMSPWKIEFKGLCNKPQTFDLDPRLNGFGVNLPSVHVSGDYYDLIRTGPDTVAFVIADAMGHGMPAALLMAAVRATVRMGLGLKLDWHDLFLGLDEVIAQAKGQWAEYFANRLKSEHKA